MAYVLVNLVLWMTLGQMMAGNLSQAHLLLGGKWCSRVILIAALSPEAGLPVGPSQLTGTIQVESMLGVDLPSPASD